MFDPAGVLPGRMAHPYGARTEKLRHPSMGMLRRNFGTLLWISSLNGRCGWRRAREGAKEIQPIVKGLPFGLM